MKKIFLSLLTVLLLFLTVYGEEANITQNILDEYINIYGDKIQIGLDRIDMSGIKTVDPDFSLSDLIKSIIKGEKLFSPKSVILDLIKLLFWEIKKTASLLVFIPLVAVLNSYLTLMQGENVTKGSAEAVFFICYAVIAGISASAFFETTRCVKGMLTNVSVFLRVLMPVSLASLASSGAILSATSFEILMMAIIEITELAVEKFFIPLVMIATALNISSSMSTMLNTEKLSNLMNKTAKWGLGAMLTIFVGIIRLQGMVSGSADSLTVKVTKFAASNLIPIVGGILSETVETVMNCSVVIKNTIGVIGIIIVVFIAIMPILKILACLILFRLCAAIIQPVAEVRCVKFVQDLGDSLATIFAMAVSVVIMFVVILTIIINIGNHALVLGG